MNKLSKSLAWFWVGIGALGVAIGYFVGLSQSPVIATLLPLLFGLIGGSSGFLIARIKSDQPDSTDSIMYSGIAFMVFSFAIIGSSFIALSIKSGEGRQDVQMELTLNGVKPETAIRLIAIRKQLEVLDASEKEQRQILQLALHQKSVAASTRDEIAHFLDILSKKSMSTGETIQGVLRQQAVRLNDDDKTNLKTLALLLKAIPPIFQDWLERIPSGDPIPETAINKMLLTLSNNLGELVGAQNSVALTAITNLSAYPKLLQDLLELQSTLDANAPRWKTTEMSNLPDIDFEVDKLTSLLLSKKEMDTQNSDIRGFAYNAPHKNLFDFPG